MPARISRATYADMYGPTTGDRVRLADTELFIEVEKDFTTYGEEVKFGGGKVIRDGMGQSQRTRAEGAVDTVITNALVVDHTGIYKADVGLKDGRWLLPVRLAFISMVVTVAAVAAAGVLLLPTLQAPTGHPPSCPWQAAERAGARRRSWRQTGYP